MRPIFSVVCWSVLMTGSACSAERVEPSGGLLGLRGGAVELLVAPLLDLGVLGHGGLDAGNHVVALGHMAFPLVCADSRSESPLVRVEAGLPATPLVSLSPAR